MAGVPIEDLRGSLAFTTLTDVMQFLHTTTRTGELWVEGGPEHHAAQVYFDRGTVYHAQEGDQVGIDAMVEIISWVEGSFIFSSDKATSTVTVEVSLPNALVDAARRLDERRRDQQQAENEKAPQHLMDSFIEASGVLAAILMAVDGSLIASATSDETVKMDELGAGLTALIDNLNGLGRAQGCRPFGGFFVEYDRLQLLCLPVAGAVLAVVAPERAQLGVVRHKTQHLADALKKLLPE